MPVNLTTSTIDRIKISLQQNLEKPDFTRITITHNTIHQIVRGVYNRIREIDVHSKYIILYKKGRGLALSPVIEDTIAYLVLKTP